MATAGQCWVINKFGPSNLLINVINALIHLSDIIEPKRTLVKSYRILNENPFCIMFMSQVK